jgi:hypothetical protein
MSIKYKSTKKRKRPRAFPHFERARLNDPDVKHIRMGVFHPGSHYDDLYKFKWYSLIKTFIRGNIGRNVDKIYKEFIQNIPNEIVQKYDIEKKFKEETREVEYWKERGSHDIIERGGLYYVNSQNVLCYLPRKKNKREDILWNIDNVEYNKFKLWKKFSRSPEEDNPVCIGKLWVYYSNDKKKLEEVWLVSTNYNPGSLYAEGKKEKRIASLFKNISVEGFGNMCYFVSGKGMMNFTEYTKYKSTREYSLLPEERFMTRFYFCIKNED